MSQFWRLVGPNDKAYAALCQEYWVDTAATASMVVLTAPPCYVPLLLMAR